MRDGPFGAPLFTPLMSMMVVILALLVAELALAVSLSLCRARSLHFPLHGAVSLFSSAKRHCLILILIFIIKRPAGRAMRMRAARGLTVEAPGLRPRLAGARRDRAAVPAAAGSRPEGRTGGAPTEEAFARREALGIAASLVAAGRGLLGAGAAGAAEKPVEVANYLAAAEGIPNFYVFVPNDRETPAIRAGTIGKYRFAMPGTWIRRTVANILSGNYCQPRCDEPWTEVVSRRAEEREERAGDAAQTKTRAHLLARPNQFISPGTDSAGASIHPPPFFLPPTHSFSKARRKAAFRSSCRR